MDTSKRAWRVLPRSKWPILGFGSAQLVLFFVVLLAWLGCVLDVDGPPRGANDPTCEALSALMVVVALPLSVPVLLVARFSDGAADQDVLWHVSWWAGVLTNAFVWGVVVARIREWRAERRAAVTAPPRSV